MNKVLVVDDDAEILSLVEIILGMHKFEVSVISQWEMIDTSIDAFKPDLLLLDVSLGGADGRKRLKQSKETQDLPVILFSANAIPGNDLADCQAQDFIAKPFELSHLVKTIQTHLN
jgi:DNA-binding response OmpR family regulator